MNTICSERSDRRENARMRALFDYAYPLLETFFDPRSGWDVRTRQHVAVNLLKSNFPELHQDDVHTLLQLAYRVYGERGSCPGGSPAGTPDLHSDRRVARRGRQ